MIAVLIGCTAQIHATAPERPATVTAKLLRYAQWVVRQHDLNKDGRLEADEWGAMQGEPGLADLNHDRQITAEEFAQYIANYSAGRAIRLATAPGGQAMQGQTLPGQTLDGNLRDGAPPDAAIGQGADPRRDLKFFANLPAGVPAWFVERDTDGDGQLTLSEFTPKLHKTEVDDFNRYDSNRDGIVTLKEFLRSGKDAPGKTSGSPAAREPSRSPSP